MKKDNHQNNKPKLSILVIMVVIILSLVQIVISHHLSTSGEKVRQLEEKTVQLEQENRQLNEEISNVGSLANVSFKATELGLVRTSQVEHLAPQIPVALK